MIIDMLKRLTDNYIKKTTSNTYKLIKIFADELTEVKETLELTEEWRDIEKTEGATLDLLGADLGEPRRNRNDSDYRNAILFAIVKNTSGGDIERLNEVFETAIGDNFIGVQETWSQTDGAEYDGEPAGLLIMMRPGVQLPYSEIDRIIAGGVSARFYSISIPVSNLQLGTSFESLDAIFKVAGTFNAGGEVLK